MARSSATFAKRQKERARQEKQRAKMEKRQQRKLNNAAPAAEDTALAQENVEPGTAAPETAEFPQASVREE
jgi:hypothetical protein